MERQQQLWRKSAKKQTTQRNSLDHISIQNVQSVQHFKRPLSSCCHHSIRPESRLSQLPPRQAESSLGFVRTGSSTTQGYKPLGFDLARYIESTGSSEGVTIGVNGRSSTGEYFTSYMKDCEIASQKSEHVLYLSDSDVEDIEDVSSEHGITKQERIAPVPLCWEDQLKKKPEQVRTAGKSPIWRPYSLTHSKQQTGACRKAESSGLDIEEIRSSLSVMLSLGETSVMDWTKLKNLTIGSSSHEFKITNKDTQSESLRLNHLVQILTKKWDLESLQNVFCIWFKTDPAQSKTFSGLTFEVFLSSPHDGRKPSTKAFSKLKAEQITDAVSLLVVEHQIHTQAVVTLLDKEELKVSVMCSNPRCLVFSTTALVPVVPSSSVSEEHGPVPVHITPKCFVKRESYINLDEDDDRTDLQDLARNFPDLNFHGFPSPHHHVQNPQTSQIKPALLTYSSVAETRKKRGLHRPRRQIIGLPQSNYVGIVSMLRPYISKPH